MISEEDLKIRGEGDVFGTDQSGSNNYRRLANVIVHQAQMLQAREDALNLQQQAPEEFKRLQQLVLNDKKVTQTI